jgi:hypothetical protein
MIPVFWGLWKATRSAWCLLMAQTHLVCPTASLVLSAEPHWGMRTAASPGLRSLVVVTDTIVVIFKSHDVTGYLSMRQGQTCPWGSLHSSFWKIHLKLIKCFVNTSSRWALFPDWPSFVVPHWSAYKGCQLDAFEIILISFQLHQ